MDFDSTRLYYSHQQLQRSSNDNVFDVDEYGNPIATSVDGNAAANGGGEDQVHLPAVRRHFREFLRTYCSFLGWALMLLINGSLSRTFLSVLSFFVWVCLGVYVSACVPILISSPRLFLYSYLRISLPPGHTNT